MLLSAITRFTKSATSLAMVLGTSSTLVLISTEPAFAQNSGGSSVRGSGGRGGTRVLSASESSGETRSGRGAESRRDAKASHAATEVAASSSRTEMNVYRDEYLALTAATSEKTAALEEYMRLRDLTDDEIAQTFPDGGYDRAVSKATLMFSQTQAHFEKAQHSADQSLLQMTGGRQLSEDELASLHLILGL